MKANEQASSRERAVIVPVFPLLTSSSNCTLSHFHLFSCKRKENELLKEVPKHYNNDRTV